MRARLIREGTKTRLARLAIALIVRAMLFGCGRAVETEADGEPACQRSEYELQRTRYRCTSEGELETLECEEWVTLEVCAEPEACSPGPEPRCS